MHTSNCEKLLQYEHITTTVGSLMLLIFGVTILMSSLKMQNTILIIVGIGTTIIGFGGLLLGNYVFALFFNALC